jgi:hypothetical protein
MDPQFGRVATSASLASGLLAVAGLLAGCSTWKEAATDTFELPAARMSADSVALEITFVRVPVGRPEINAQLWQQVDEQLLPAETRRHLSDNGFRCGLVGTQLPDVLRDLLAKQTETRQIDQAVTSEMDVLAQNQRVQRRAGQRFEIVSSSPRDEMVVLYKDLIEQKVRGKPYPSAQCIFAAKPFPQGDGAVRLELTPEIHHGEPRKQWVAGQGTFQLLSGREREVYHDLLIDLRLGPGQTLIVSCTPEMKGLGQNFFVEDGQGDAQQKLLLVRLAQVQRDELFEPAAN